MTKYFHFATDSILEKFVDDCLSKYLPYMPNGVYLNPRDTDNKLCRAKLIGIQLNGDVVLLDKEKSCDVKPLIKMSHLDTVTVSGNKALGKFIPVIRNKAFDYYRSITDYNNSVKAKYCLIGIHEF